MPKRKFPTPKLPPIVITDLKRESLEAALNDHRTQVEKIFYEHYLQIKNLLDNNS
jgi:hypothetical protein